MHGAVHRTRRIAHNWHISVENRRPCYSGHYLRFEDKLMNIFGTCTHCSDIYSNSMMLAFEDFIRRHLYSQPLKGGTMNAKSTSYAEGSILDSRIIFRIQSSLELQERCITGNHSSCLHYGCMRRCPLSSTRG